MRAPGPFGSYAAAIGANALRIGAHIGLVAGESGPALAQAA